MKQVWKCLFGAAALTTMASCVQKLPDVADFDRSDRRAQELASSERSALENRRSQIGEAEYQLEKTALENRIAQRSISLVWTSHSLTEAQLENKGIPTPDHPQEIAVPQAGSLPTGSDYRKFNQQADATIGNTNDTISGMRQMMGSSSLGANTHQRR